MLKKVNTEQIVVTPTPNTRIKLSELNSILDEMKLGEEAVKRLAELDSQMGMQDPAAVARRMRGENKDAYTPETIPETKRLPPETPLMAPQTGLLGDDAIAFNLRQQAERMQREAEGLVAEARRLLEQANELVPAPATAAPIAKPVLSTEKKTKGRPKKTAATA